MLTKSLAVEWCAATRSTVERHQPVVHAGRPVTPHAPSNPAIRAIRVDQGVIKRTARRTRIWGAPWCNLASDASNFTTGCNLVVDCGDYSL